ncbi:DUF2079 domain-containing protein, partial [Acidobacteriota bacterium]
KEYIPLVFIGLGISALFSKRHRLQGGLAVVVGTVWFLVAVLWVIPHFAGAQHPYYVEHGYSHLGGTGGFGGVLRTLISDPLAFLAALVSLDKAGFCLLLLLPLGLLPLLKPRFLLPGLPILGILLLHPSIANIHNHHASPLVPVLVLAAAGGIATLDRWFKEKSRIRSFVVPYLLACSFLSAVFIGPSPLLWKFWTPGEWKYWGHLHNYRVTSHDRLADRMIAAIPDEASTSASLHLAGHLGHRQYCWCFPLPRDMGEVDAVALDLLEFYSPNFWPRDKEIDGLSRLLADSRFALSFHLDGLLLFQQNGTDKPGGLNTSIEAIEGTEQPEPAGQPEAGQSLVLERFSLRRAENSLAVEAEWSCQEATEERIMAVTTIESPERRYRIVHLPSYGIRPMQTWKTGNRFRESVTASLPPDFEATSWKAKVGVYRVSDLFPVLTDPKDDVYFNQTSALFEIDLGALRAAETSIPLVSYPRQD